VAQKNPPGRGGRKKCTARGVLASENSPSVAASEGTVTWISSKEGCPRRWRLIPRGKLDSNSKNAAKGEWGGFRARPLAVTIFSPPRQGCCLCHHAAGLSFETVSRRTVWRESGAVDSNPLPPGSRHRLDSSKLFGNDTE